MKYLVAFLAFIPIIDWGQDCQWNSIDIEVSGIDSEIGWSIAQDNGWAIISGALESFSNVCIEDGCFPFNMYDGNGDGWNETTITISYSLTNEIIFYGTLDDGFFETINIQLGETILCPVYGCTDYNACNYNPEATIDDTSCTYAEEFYDCNGVCLDDIDGDGICDSLCNEDLNADGVVSVQDLLIVLSEFGCTSSCENDINQDGYVAVDDLLQVLSEFGNTCD